MQLGNIESLNDIPIPTMRKSKQTNQDQEEQENTEVTMPKNMDDLGKSLLPKSLFEQKLVTAVKENVDPEKLERNRQLTQTKTPAQLAQINSLGEFPVPEKIKNIFNQTGEKKEQPVAPPKKRRYILILSSRLKSRKLEH